MKRKTNKVVVVLVGDTDHALLGRLRAQFKEYADYTEFKIVAVQ
jgi:hypothetical protein